MTTLRRRLVPSSDPGADPVCRLTREDSKRRRADTGLLFAQLAEQHQTARGHEFVFHGDPVTLWAAVSLFVDEESKCCPFFTYEQIEEPQGVILHVINPPSLVIGP